MKCVVDGGDCLEFDGLEATTNTLFTVTSYNYTCHTKSWF